MSPSLNRVLVSDDGGDEAGPASPVDRGSYQMPSHREQIRKITTLLEETVEEMVAQAGSILKPEGKMRTAHKLVPGLSIYHKHDSEDCQICGGTKNRVTLLCCFRKGGIVTWCKKCVGNEKIANYHEQTCGHKILTDNGAYFEHANHLYRNFGMSNDADQLQELLRDQVEGEAAVAALEDRSDFAHENGLHIAAVGGVALMQPELVNAVDQNDMAHFLRDGLPEDGNRYIGSCVVAFFNQEPFSFIGKVVAWDKNEGKDLYRVVYHDAVS